MINLLPPQQKEELLDQWRLRLSLILGIIFLSFFLSLFLILFLVKSYIALDLETKRIILEEDKRIISLSQDLEKEITDSNAILSELSSFYKENLNLTQILEEINESLPPESYLTGFSLGFFTKPEGEEIPKISLSGYCKNRDILLKFKENLEGKKEFSEVNFSPESWVKPTDVNFSVSFELTK